MKKYLCLGLILAAPLFSETPLIEYKQTPLTRYKQYKSEYGYKGVQTAERIFEKLQKSFEEKEYKEVVKLGTILTEDLSSSPFAAEGAYYKAEAFLKMKDYERANEAFSFYLSHFSQLKHFEEAMQKKFEIAEAFSNGEKKRLFSGPYLPRVISAEDDALNIYDEIITAMPREEMCAIALHKKGRILTRKQDFDEAIEVYQVLIRRFPTHPLAPISYLDIAKVYYKKSISLFADPDVLELAKLNIQKFEASFPQHEGIITAKKQLQEMKNYFAKELYEMARYFTKKKKNEAAELYYRAILTLYPDSASATDSQKALEREIK